MMSTRQANAHADAVRTLEAEFGDLVSRFRRHVAATAERLSPGLLPATFKVFTSIARLEQTTLSSLAEHLTADKGQVSRAVRELEQLSLVVRTPDPNDGRSSLIAATDDGLARLRAARGSDESPLVLALEAWSIDDIRELTRLLHALGSGVAPEQVR